MKRVLTAALALMIALSLTLASAESIGSLLAGSANRSVGNEAAVYESFRGVLARAKGEDLALGDWSQVTNYLSKCATGEALDGPETAFDQSLSAYEKFFLLALDHATMPEELAEELKAGFDAALEQWPEAGESLYLSAEGEAFLPALAARALERLGWTCTPETVGEVQSLYAIADENGEVVLSARQALTTLPGAMLMGHVPPEKREESAAALAKLAGGTPCTVDWQRLANLNDAFFDAFAGETEADDADEADLAAAEAKWLALARACDAYDVEPDEDALAAVAASVKALGEGVEVAGEGEGLLSLRLIQAAPTAAATATPTATAKPTAAPTAAADATDAVEVDPAYALNYVIYVSKDSHTIAVLGRDSDGKFSRVLNKYPTGIGKAGQTRAGSYTIAKKERWHSWSGDTYSPYSTRQSGGAYIHGPIYSAKDSNKMLPDSYNEIGTECSSGCLRTTCAAAAWIYYNCPTGTVIIIANDRRYSASRPAKIPSSQTWDPTDPGANPEIPVTDFTVSPAELTLAAGSSATLNVSGVQPANNSTGGRFRFASSDAGVATVSASGVVTAVAPGTARVTVTADDPNACSRSVAVTVTDAQATATPTPAPTATPEATAAPEPTAEPAPTAVPDDAIVVDENSAQERVLYIQNLLAELGFLPPADANGVFGDSTHAAIGGFQAAVNQVSGQDALQVNGLMNAVTLRYLEYFVALARSQQTPVPTDEPIPTPSEEPTPTPEPTAAPDPTEEPEATPEPTEAPVSTEEPAPTEEPADTAAPEATEVPTEAPTQAPEAEPTAAPQPTQAPADPTNDEVTNDEEPA